MRSKSLIVAALLASSAASAQDYSADCRGETISDLARCAAERAPAPAEAPLPEANQIAPVPGEEAPLAPRRLQPSSLGGALQPTDQRRPPARVGTPADARTSVGVAPIAPSVDPLGRLTDDPTSPAYGAGRTSIERQRILDPLSGTRLRLPGESR